jgi:hypothetical protein
MVLIELWDRHIGWKAAMRHVLKVLRQRTLPNESGLTHADL